MGNVTYQSGQVVDAQMSSNLYVNIEDGNHLARSTEPLSKQHRLMLIHHETENRNGTIYRNDLKPLRYIVLLNNETYMITTLMPCLTLRPTATVN